MPRRTPSRIAPLAGASVAALGLAAAAALWSASPADAEPAPEPPAEGRFASVAPNGLPAGPGNAIRRTWVRSDARSKTVPIGPPRDAGDPPPVPSVEEAAVMAWGSKAEVERRKRLGLPLLPPDDLARHEQSLADEAARLAAGAGAEPGDD